VMVTIWNAAGTRSWQGRWLRDEDPDWPEFTQRWMAFNAHYDTVRQPDQL